MTATAMPKTAHAGVRAQLTEELLSSYRTERRAIAVSKRYLPSRDAIVEILGLMLDLMYPGYFGRRDVSAEGLAKHVAARVDELEHAAIGDNLAIGDDPAVSGHGALS